MATETNIQHALHDSTYELFIGGLSILSIANIVLLYVVQTEVVSSVIFIVDLILSVVFLFDFALRFITAPSRSEYFFRDFGWADLLASLPFPQAKILRIFRVVRVTRLLRKYGAHAMLADFVAKRAQNTLLTVVLLLVIIAEFGGMGVAWAEQRSPDANIQTGADAIWYIFATITTVGYGDRYPVTTSGRVMGMIIMFSGVGVFAVFTGYIANVFLEPPKKKKQAANGVVGPQAALEEIKKLMAEQEKTQAELRNKMEEIERLL